jgi:ankyrin repeat protein
VSLGAFIEIWRGFRAARPCRYIYLLVDGLEQCGDECFEEFCSTVEKIQMPILLPTRTLSQPPDERPPLPAVLKVLYTCRRTPAVDGRLSPGAFWIRPSFTAKDIGAYVDWELRRLRGEGVQDNERLNALKTQIKHSAGCFWPYARFAVEQVAQSFPLPAELTFDSEGLMPIGLKSSLDEYVQSCLRSKTDERYMATVLTFMASCRVAGPVRVRDIEDMLRGVHDEEDLQGINVARSLSANYSGMFFVDPENRMSFLHDSVAYCMADLLSPEQKYTNLAFTCLNYLLRDTFCRRLPLSEKESAESDDWLLANHPFYNYAANSWLQHLRRADNLAIQLLPLLRAFLDKDCSQYKTWCSWRDWRHSKTPGVSSHAEPIAALLTQVGCVNILAHVLSPPDAPPGQGLQGALRSWISRCGPGDGDEEGFLETENWPEVMDGEGYTALMLAIQNGAADVIDFVLQWDPDVNARSASGTNPLMVSLSRASETDRSPPLNLLEELLRRGANPNTSDNDGLTALHHACALGYLEATRLLLDHGALVHIASAKGISPLEEAFNGRSTGVFAELIDRGADADAMWSMGEVPLSQCVIKGELDIFRILLDVADVNQINGEGATALLVACSRGDRHEHIRLLLSRPGLDLDFVDRNWQTNFEGTPHNSLSLSAHKGDYLATEMLLSAGADPGLVPRLPVLPLYRAVRNGHLEIARLLLAHQSPVNNFTRLCGSRTPLSAAVRTGSVDMVALLLEHGADPTVEDAYGSDGPLLRALTGDPPKLEIIGRLLQARIPPDMGAAKGGESALVNKAVRTRNVDVLRMVLEHTSDSSSWLQPSRSPSPLHTAAWLGSSEMCDVILQHEPRLLDFQSEGIPNESPLIVASKQNHPDVVRFLLGKGARADQVSFYYKASPLCAACTAGSYASVKLLLEAAPEMVDVPFFYGGTPLTEACAVGNLKIVEALLEAGGDPSYRSADGLSCISSALRGSRGKRPGILLELLMKYGLDVNAVVSSSGFTVLGAAIAHGSPREVKWLLEHGADPLRSQRSAFEPESWKNALQLAVTVASSSVVDLLLEPQWCLLDHWAESASSGVSPWRDLKLRRRHVESISKVYNACEQARVQTGKDLFTTFMRQPNNLGWTLVDLAVGCASEPEPRQQFSACLASKITQLLAVDYCRELHLDMVEEICWDLFMHRGFDREAIAMLSAAISVPTINRTRGEILEGTEALDTCGGCEDGIRELCLACPLCREFRCTKCAALPDNQVFHEHDWVEIPLRWDPEWKPERHRIDLEKINEQLVRSPELDSDQEVLDDESEKTVRDPYPSEHLQASLQLATLHALGYLAIRRPLFTAYMPLSPATEALIAPWMPVIREQRRHIERRDLSYEMHWTRRLEEMLYLQRGLGVGYHDVEDVRRGWVLQDMRYLWRLPEREETPKRQGNGKRDTRGEGKDFSQRER